MPITLAESAGGARQAWSVLSNEQCRLLARSVCDADSTVALEAALGARGADYFDSWIRSEMSHQAQHHRLSSGWEHSGAGGGKQDGHASPQANGRPRGPGSTGPTNGGGEPSLFDTVSRGSMGGYRARLA